MLFVICPFAYATDYSGICGDNIIYSFDETSGELTVSGTGNMQDFGFAPWYKYRSTIKTVKITEGVNSIGDKAFEDCEQLSEAWLPDGLTHIGDSAFKNCRNLKSIDIPDTVYVIEREAFYNCDSLYSIEISPIVSELKSSTFLGCESLTDVLIPISVSSIEESCFEGCTNLKNIELTNFVSLGYRSFAESGLRSFVFPKYSSVVSSVFYNCADLESVTLPSNKNMIIIRDAFTGCTNLKDIYYEGTSEQWENIVKSSEEFSKLDDSFDELLDLLNIHYECKVPEYNSMFPANPKQYNQIESCNGEFAGNLVWSFDSSDFTLTIDGKGDIPDFLYTSIADSRSNAPWWYMRNYIKNIKIGNEITKIGNWSFSDCAGLENINFGSGVTAIGNNCFNNCSYLSHVVIPGNIKSIGEQSFQGCYCLKDVVFMDGVESIERFAFSYVASGLASVTISDSVKSIEEGVFAESGLSCINFSGSEAEWKALSISIENDYLSEVSMNYNYKIKDALDNGKNALNKESNNLRNERQEEFNIIYVVIPVIATIIILCGILFIIKKKRH